MNEYHWATPEALGKLTITQMICLAHDKPPGGPRECASFDELTEELARLKDQEERWNGGI